MMDFCTQFMRDKKGATAIEYGLIVSGITLAILGTIQALSTSVRDLLWAVVAAATNP